MSNGIKGLEITVHKNGDQRDYSGIVGFVQMNRDMLVGYRDDGRIPSQELIDDIAAYNYILNSPDPEKTARLYMDTKKEHPGRPREMYQRMIKQKGEDK